MEEIDLKEVFEIFWEKKVTIILLTAIFMVLGFIYSSFIVVPEYSSSTTLVLAQSASDEEGTGAGITTNDITLNSKLISTYTTLVKSNGVVRAVKTNLELEDSEESIKKNVSVSAEEGTDIIKITVTNTKPEKAARIANEMAKVFTEKVKDIYKLDNVYSLDPAEVAEDPSNINIVKTMIIFAAVGLIIGAGYIFILFMVDNSIKTAEDVEKVDIPVLASIPVYEPEAQIRDREKGKKRSKGGRR